MPAHIVHTPHLRIGMAHAHVHMPHLCAGAHRFPCTSIPVRIMPVPNIPTGGHTYATRHIRVLACAR